MAITLRSAKQSGATTKGSALTHAEMDANFTSFMEDDGSALVGFMQTGTGASETNVQAKMLDALLVRRADYDTEVNFQASKKRVAPTGFSFVPGTIWDCPGPGLARHDIDIEQSFLSTYDAQMLNPFQIDFSKGKFVDPVNGSDANAGTFALPYLTITKAYQNVTEGSIWLKPGVYTERFLAKDTDNVFSGAIPRAIMIRALNGPGTVTLRSPGDQPSALTWTLSGSVYTATPSGGQLADHIIYIDNGKEIDLDWQASVGAVTGAAKGWFQDSSTKLITVSYEGRNIENVKVNLEIMYTRSATSGSLGAVTYFQDLDFRGDTGFILLYFGTMLNRPVLYAKRCTFKYCTGSGVRNEGGITFFQDCRSERNLTGDGLSYAADSAGPLTVAQSLEVDCTLSNNGVIGSRLFSASRTLNGSSMHSGGFICRINGYAEGNYGPNFADGGTKWMVGTRLGNPYGEIGGGEALLGYYNLWNDSDTSYLDNVQAGGRLATYGLYVNAGTVNAYNCIFSGTTAAAGQAGGTTLQAYDPRNP